jgi:hypothetical protein
MTSGVVTVLIVYLKVHSHLVSEIVNFARVLQMNSRAPVWTRFVLMRPLPNRLTTKREWTIAPSKLPFFS